MTEHDRTHRTRTGPLQKLRVVEVAGIGPAPFGVMLLADLGADVIRIDRPGAHAGNPVAPEHDFLNRNRRSIELNLKDRADLDVARRIVEDADVLVEGFRPGVAERLGLGPDECLEINPRLVYARMTGWGQDGPLAQRAGHDINYIARTGLLDAIGRRGEAPTLPLNIVGDFGGGGMLLALGVLAAVQSARETGVGQVVDVSILDGTVLLTTMLQVWRHAGVWVDERESNMLDGGAHFYRIYETADGRHLSVGAIEPQFYEQLRLGLGIDLDEAWTRGRTDRSAWPILTCRLAEIFRTRDLDSWLAAFEGLDACIAPVLTAAEAPTDEHNVARGVFIEVDGVVQPAPGPRFSGTPAGLPSGHPVPGKHSAEIRQAVATSSLWH